MHLIDWILLALPLCIVLSIAIYTQRYMKSVADFMSGGRLAGPYLLAVASGEMQAGAGSIGKKASKEGQAVVALYGGRHAGSF